MTRVVKEAKVGFRADSKLIYLLLSFIPHLVGVVGEMEFYMRELCSLCYYKSGIVL